MGVVGESKQLRRHTSNRDSHEYSCDAVPVTCGDFQMTISRLPNRSLFHHFSDWLLLKIHDETPTVTHTHTHTQGWQTVVLQRQLSIQDLITTTFYRLKSGKNEGLHITMDPWVRSGCPTRKRPKSYDMWKFEIFQNWVYLIPGFCESHCS